MNIRSKHSPAARSVKQQIYRLLLVVSVLLAVVIAGLTLMMVYQMILSLFGFGRGVKDYEDHAPQSRC